MWNRALRKILNLYLSVFLASIEKTFILGGRLSTRLYFFEVLRFSGILWFHNILSLKSIGNLWGSLYTPCLLLITSLCFTCGERKIWTNIKTCQNFMTMTAWKIVFFSGSNCWKQSFTNWNLLDLSKRTS